MALHAPWGLERFKSEYDIKLWLIWCVRNGFVHIWKKDDSSTEPTGGMILRPVSLERIRDYGEIRVAEEIFWTDPGGEISWVDFLWAPGQKENVLRIIAPSTGNHWIGWQRRNSPKTHMLEIRLMDRGALDF